MRLRNCFLPFILLMISLACKSSYTDAQRAADRVAMQSALSTTGLKFEAQTAVPQNTQALNRVANDILIQRGDNANRINLSGDGFFLKFDEENLQMNLPFYGERRLGGGNYAEGSPFDFEGEVNDLKVEQDNNQLNISFSTRNDSDTMEIDLRISSKKSATLLINSVAHTFITFYGNVDVLNQEEALNRLRP